MGTLTSELGHWQTRATRNPLVYVDANLPAGLVAFMRERLGWDVFFVMEHADLRRARDGEHFRRAREMRRTLLTLDRDYFDDRRFPPPECGGVIVLSAPDERALSLLLRRLDRQLLRCERSEADGDRPPARDLPLAGRKLHVYPGSRVATDADR
jgi:predicted nuclease of predicted toxin-antitoxin system